jgi:hypothetical protein
MPPIHGLEHLVLTRHRNTVVSDDRALRRAAARGSMTRLRIGAYVPTAVWVALSREDRHRLAAAAAAEMRATFIATHRTAAVLHGVPLLGSGDGLVHSRTTEAAGTRSEHGYRKHAVADLGLHVTRVDDVPTTTVERTVVDIALTESFESGVVAADWSLRNGSTKDALRQALDELSPKRGRGRVEAVVAFADAAAGSVGESWSRVLIERSGFPRPQLQARFDDLRGLIGWVDFYWPEFHLIGEFDGMEKYSKQQFIGEKVPAEVVTDEKIREDRLRATETRPGVSRWIWPTLMRNGQLERQLRAAGLPILRGRPGVFG